MGASDPPACCSRMPIGMVPPSTPDKSRQAIAGLPMVRLVQIYSEEMSMMPKKVVN